MASLLLRIGSIFVGNKLSFRENALSSNESDSSFNDIEHFHDHRVVRTSALKVLLIKNKAPQEQIKDMLSALENYIKVAVDIKLGVLAGGGVMHADCEKVLLGSGSRQEDVWGADWYPNEKLVAFGSLINIRPKQKNRSMEIQDPKIRQQVEEIIRKLMS